MLIQIMLLVLTSGCMSQVLVYFAVAKKGDAPGDGKTNVNPEGLTAGGHRVCSCPAPTHTNRWLPHPGLMFFLGHLV